MSDTRPGAESLSLLEKFHPAVKGWFQSSFEAPTEVQLRAWREIASERNVLIAAPTGSGKTFAAFLNAIDELVLADAGREDGVRVLYVSPLKALSNDIERNLRAPLEGVEQWFQEREGRPSGIRAMVRTGDTTAGEREKMRRQPPQILVTTPESLFILMTSDSGRNMLAGVETVIIDEIHAVAGSKRGSHLALTLARLDALTGEGGKDRPRRIGLSATQKPIDEIARFLTGGEACSIVDTGHQKQREILLEIPASPLSPVMANEVWAEIYDRVAELAAERRTTLVFVNTRRLAERMARHLAERLGDEVVTAHHGSLSRSHRLEAEQALKAGHLSVLVATASLELGIDIGHVDLVCQIGSPGSISALIQRVGRAGHGVGEVSRGRLFPITRDDLVECAALLSAIAADELDRVCIPRAPLDVLAQQIVAEVSAGERGCDELFAQFTRAWPYRDLERTDFDSVVEMLAQGYATRRGRRSAYVHHDAVNGRLKPRPAARLTALQNGGVIPDQFDYEVTMLPGGIRVGTLNEDFAFESIPGDIFQLGNTSYRILKIETGRVLVEDAQGLPPTIPFWFGERPGRSDELSACVSQLRAELDRRLDGDTASGEALGWLDEQGVPPPAAEQLSAYLGAAKAALDGLPTQDRIVMERFFDDTGDMHLVIHAPFGSRIMRAWGLALRKRFCRRFNFELQAAALEDCLILSLGETHSFALEDVRNYLNSASVEEVLIQALLDAPMFEVRWRWNATVALAVQRMRNGQRLPPQWQRNQAEDLVSVVFPDQLACVENIRGEREIPDHPLVQQTISDCLHETMDIDGLVRLLERIQNGEVRVDCKDLTGPSPLSAEIINARPYAFLDDGDAENRRTRAISQNPDDLAYAATQSLISVEAIDQVKAEAWLCPRNADELHDGLLQAGFVTQVEYRTGSASTGACADPANWNHWFQSLAEAFRAVCVKSAEEGPGTRSWWVATERLSEWRAIHPAHAFSPDPGSVWKDDRTWEREQALVELLRSRLTALGPVSVTQLVEDFALEQAAIEAGLAALVAEGYVLELRSESDSPRWCERRLLSRIHRYNRENRRRATRPVPPDAYMRFLLSWHALEDADCAVEQALGLLEGWCAPVDAWETNLLKARCSDYEPTLLDQQFLGGMATWFRPPLRAGEKQQVVAATPIAIVPRTSRKHWLRAATFSATGNEHAHKPTGADTVIDRVLELLDANGAMFAEDIAEQTGLLPAQFESVLSTLVARGLVTADAFSPLRWLVRPSREKLRMEKRAKRGRFGSAPPAALLGRWDLVSSYATGDELFSDETALAQFCGAILRRYGVVFRAVLERESLLPPWRFLLAYLRRMEDRGEVLGGRFVDGFSGEQFALPEATGLLRRCQKPRDELEYCVVNSTDPLNLGGIITPGAKTAARTSNRVLLQQGVPVARASGTEIEMLKGADSAARREAQRRLSVVSTFPGVQAER